MNTETSTLALAAKESTLAKIRLDWSRLLNMGDELESRKIKFVNLGREIGLSLQGLCGHEQMRLSFFENIKAELPDKLTFSAAQKCIKLANALADPVATIEEAGRAEQLLLQAAGIEDEPERSGPQAARDSTPDTFVFTTLATAKDRLMRRLADVSQWDELTRQSVREQIAKHKAWLVEIEAAL